MATRPGVWRAVHPHGSSSRFLAWLRIRVGLVIAAAWPVVLASLVMRNFQLLEEDADGTFWASAPRYTLAYCELCQRLRVISARSDSARARICTGGRFFHGHAEREMRCFTSGQREGFPPGKS